MATQTQTTDTARKFLCLAGPHLNGKNVAVYELPGGAVELIAQCDGTEIGSRVEMSRDDLLAALPQDPYNDAADTRAALALCGCWPPHPTPQHGETS